MPYSMSEPGKLPANVKSMPKQMQKQWCAVWNSAYSKCTKGGGDTKKCEGSAFAQANGVANKSKGKREVSLSNFVEGLDGLLHRLLYGEGSGDWYGQDTVTQKDTLKQRAINVPELYQGIQKAMSSNWPSPDAVMPIDLYHEGSTMFLICSMDNRLYRCEVMVDGADQIVLGTPVEVTRAFTATTPEGSQALIDKTPMTSMDAMSGMTEDIQPVNGEPVYNQYRSLKVVRAADGSPRWLMVAASSVLNRVNQIDSNRLFDSFVENSEYCGMPYLTFWHQEEPLRIGEADYIAREGNLYIATGSFDKTPLGLAAAKGIEEDPSYWGTSISYDPLAPADMVEVVPNVTVPVYSEGWNDEISVLPESRAANWFTVSVTRGVNTMRKEVKDALAKLVGADLAEQFAGQVDNTNREIEDKGLITRENKTVEAPVIPPVVPVVPPVAPPVVVPPATVPPVQRAETTEVVLDDEFIAQMVAAFEKSPIMQHLSVAVAELTANVPTLQAAQLDVTRSLEEFDTRLTTLTKTDMAKQKEWTADLPAGRTVKVTYQPRVSRSKTDEEGNDVPDLQAAANATLSNLRIKLPTAPK